MKIGVTLFSVYSKWVIWGRHKAASAPKLKTEQGHKCEVRVVLCCLPHAGTLRAQSTSKDTIQKHLPRGRPPSWVCGGETKGFTGMHELWHVICPWNKVKEQALAMVSLREPKRPSRLVLRQVKCKVLLTTRAQPVSLCE